MTGVGSTPYTAEWKWMSVREQGCPSLTLDGATLTMDGTGTASNVHAIYFCSNNKLNLKNGSNLTIKNYKQDALEWDGGDGGYNVNIETGSTYTSDHCRSGFTGTFVVTVDNSKVNVVNSTGNGSNGSHFNIKNGSTVDFSGNGSHGLSAGNLTIDNSTVTAKDNALTGIIFTGKGEFKSASVQISGTKGTSYWNAGMRLMKANASSMLTSMPPSFLSPATRSRASISTAALVPRLPRVPSSPSPATMHPRRTAPPRRILLRWAAALWCA